MSENERKTKTALNDRIQTLVDQIADLKKRWPAHSIPPAMMLRLDDLEDELENELKRVGLKRND
jgi:hypothetical protein